MIGARYAAGSALAPTNGTVVALGWLSVTQIHTSLVGTELDSPLAGPARRASVPSRSYRTGGLASGSATERQQRIPPAYRFPEVPNGISLHVGSSKWFADATERYSHDRELMPVAHIGYANDGRQTDRRDGHPTAHR